jgi:hypothetical protein
MLADRMDDNEKEIIEKSFVFFRFAILALLLAGGLIGNEFLL